MTRLHVKETLVYQTAALCPNPSIERTWPGKPGHAAHVER